MSKTIGTPEEIKEISIKMQERLAVYGNMESNIPRYDSYWDYKNELRRLSASY